MCKNDSKLIRVNIFPILSQNYRQNTNAHLQIQTTKHIQGNCRKPTLPRVTESMSTLQTLSLSKNFAWNQCSSFCCYAIFSSTLRNTHDRAIGPIITWEHDVIHNVMYITFHNATKLKPQPICTENLMKLRHVVSEIHQLSPKQTHKHACRYFAPLSRWINADAAWVIERCHTLEVQWRVKFQVSFLNRSFLTQ